MKMSPPASTLPFCPEHRAANENEKPAGSVGYEQRWIERWVQDTEVKSVQVILQK